MYNKRNSGAVKQHPPEPAAAPARETPPAGLSDDELLARLMRDDMLSNRVQAAAADAYAAALALQLSPSARVTRSWVATRHRLLEIERSRPAFCNPRSPADWNIKVRQLRAWQGFISEMQAIMNTSLDERRASWPAYQAAEQTLAYAAEHAAITARGEAALAAMPAWSASAFVASLARRGVGLTVAPDGRLQATLAGQLTAADREMLKARKAEIVAELSMAETVA